MAVLAEDMGHSNERSPGAMSKTSPQADAIPRADSSGTLNGWVTGCPNTDFTIGDTHGLVTYDSLHKRVRINVSGVDGSLSVTPLDGQSY